MEHVRKKIWIDLDNSPHIPFFKPIINELNNMGYIANLTARDCFQVCGLADRFNLRYVRIGRHYGKNKVLKFIGLLFRTLQLMPIILKEKPDLALSHGSRSQILLASLLRIPSILIADYEHSTFIVHPTYTIIPDVIPVSSVASLKSRVFSYPGIKEDVYVPKFTPDPKIIEELGIDKKDLVITIRPPATEAHYHNSESEELFKLTVDFLGKKPNTRIIMLPRNDKQAIEIKKFWQEWYKSCKIIIPDHVVDGLNLIWFSDLVISGGGTMNREAAALGVPVYSIFRGVIGSVDRYLAENGRLTLLENIKDVQTKVKLEHRNKPVFMEKGKSDTLNTIVTIISKIIDHD